jgi:RNA polymerase sigma factor (sigma-70 family)
MDRTDDKLALAAMGGDVDGFMELCRRYYRPMIAIAKAAVRDEHLAEDVAQETFAKAVRKIDSLKDPARVGGWLASICRNLATDFLRHRDDAECLGDRDLAADILEEDPEVEEVRKILIEIPIATRELVYLRYRDDLSYEEIAKLLEITPEAVHGRLWRAKHEVKKRLGQARIERSS